MIDVSVVRLSDFSDVRCRDEDSFSFDFADLEDALESLEGDQADGAVVIDKTLKN